MKLSDLKVLSEASIGFVGGSYVDEMPDISLDECINGLTMTTLENEMSLYENTRTMNNALVEAAVGAIQGDMSAQEAYDQLSEASFNDIKAKVAKVFDSILKFIRSIIDKIKVQIDKIRMSGSQLYAKYGAQVDKKDLTGFTFTGYDIMGKTDGMADTSKYEANPEMLIKESLKDKFVAPAEFKDTYYKEMKEKSKDYKAAHGDVEKMSGFSRDEAKRNMAKILTGSKKDLTNDWMSTVKKDLYGEKKELKLGSKGFTKDSVIAILKEPKNLTAIQDEYKRLENAVSRYKDTVQREVDEFNKPDAENMQVGYSVVSAYYNAYIQYVNMAIGAINQVKTIKYDFAKEQNNQAKSIFVKMMSYKKDSSKKEDASDEEDISEFDIDL